MQNEPFFSSLCTLFACIYVYMDDIENDVAGVNSCKAEQMSFLDECNIFVPLVNHQV